MIDVGEIQDPQCERGQVAVNSTRGAGEHPAWCLLVDCFVTDAGVWVHQQAPACWEDDTAELRCESRLLDPGGRRARLPGTAPPGSGDQGQRIQLVRDAGCRTATARPADCAPGRRAVSCERSLSTATDPTEAESCLGCGATHGVQRIVGTLPKVDAGMCTACGLHFAVTVINPALSIVGVLPTPALGASALLLRTRSATAQARIRITV